MEGWLGGVNIKEAITYASTGKMGCNDMTRGHGNLQYTWCDHPY